MGRSKEMELLHVLNTDLYPKFENRRYFSKTIYIAEIDGIFIDTYLTVCKVVDTDIDT